MQNVRVQRAKVEETLGFGTKDSQVRVTTRSGANTHVDTPAPVTPVVAPLVPRIDEFGKEVRGGEILQAQESVPGS